MSVPPLPPPGADGAPAPRLAFGPALTLGAWIVRYTPETLSQIPAQWARFASQLPFVPGRVGPATYGLCYEWVAGELEYGCAVEVLPGRPLPTGWTQLTIPTVRYAVFSHEGDVFGMPGFEAWILCQWLPGSGHLRLRGLAGGLELVERYGPRFDPATRRGDIEIWLPLEG